MSRLPGILALALCAILAIPSCDYESEEDLFMPEPLPDSAFWAADIDPIMIANCGIANTCHKDNPARLSLVTYTEVSSSKDMVIDRAVIKMDMPAGGPPLSKKDRDKLQLWVDQGALNN